MTSSASFSERLTLSANLAMAVLIMMERMLSAFSDQRSAGRSFSKLKTDYC
jgi:hypothetical protein